MDFEAHHRVQLSDSAPVDYANFGKPEFAFITITGNDLDFEKYVFC